MLRVNNLSGGQSLVGPVFKNWAAKRSETNEHSHTFSFTQSATPGSGEVLFANNDPGDRAWLIFILAEDTSGSPTLSSITLEGVDISGSQVESNVENDIFCASYLVRPPTLSGTADVAVDFGSFDTQDGIACHIMEFSNVQSVTKKDSANFDSQDNEVDQSQIALTVERGDMVVLFCLMDLDSTPSGSGTGFFSGGLAFGPNNNVSSTMARFMFCKLSPSASLGNWTVSSGLSVTDFIAHGVVFN